MSPNCVKRSDVTRNPFEWQLGDNNVKRPHPPYFIVLGSSMKTLEVKAIEFTDIKFPNEPTLF